MRTCWGWKKPKGEEGASRTWSKFKKRHRLTHVNEVPYEIRMTR